MTTISMPDPHAIAVMLLILAALYLFSRDTGDGDDGMFEVAKSLPRREHGIRDADGR